MNPVVLFLIMIVVMIAIVIYLHTYVQVKKSTVTVNDITVSYHIYNTIHNKSIILINSYGNPDESWNSDFIKTLCVDHQVIVYDIRGVDGTLDAPNSPNQHSVEQYSTDLYWLLRNLNINKTSVLGYSFGGLIAQKLACDHPEIINNLILIGANVSGSQIPTTVQNLLFDLSGSDADIWSRRLALLYPPQHVKKYASLTPTFNRVALSNQKTAIFNWGGSPIEMISAKTLLIVGKEDVLTPPLVVLEMSNRIANSWFLQISDCGHDIIRLIPVTIGRMINRFDR